MTIAQDASLEIGVPSDLPQDRRLKLRQLLDRHPGTTPVTLKIGTKSYSGISVTPSPELIAEINRVLEVAPKNAPLTVAEAARLHVSKNPHPHELPNFGWLLGAGSPLTPLQLVVASELDRRFPGEATCGEIWRAIFPHHRDTKTGEFFVRDDSTDIDRTTWLKVEGRDELTKTQIERERTLQFERIEPSNPHAGPVRPPDGTPPPAPIYLRKNVIVQLRNLGLPITSSSSAEDAGYRLTTSETEMRDAQAAKRQAIKTQERRLDHQLASVHRVEHLLSTGELLPAPAPAAEDLAPRSSEPFTSARVEQLERRRKVSDRNLHPNRRSPGHAGTGREGRRTASTIDELRWDEVIGS